jgi:ribose-phosphate pyrophosphokinase
MQGKMKILAGNSNAPLAVAIAAHVKEPLTRCSVRRFADLEIFVEILENVRGRDAFIVQSTSYPTNDNLMELLIMIDALRRASAQRITAVIPYFGHAGQIQGFFDIPTDNLFAAPTMVRDIKERGPTSKIMVVSPDVGGVVRARALAKRLDAPLAIVDKRRERAGESEVMNIIGDVAGRHCVLIDDIVDSGGTLCNAAEALLEQGAASVSAYITHGVLSGGAVARIAGSKLKELVITDSIAPTEPVRVARNIRVMSIATLIGEAIVRIAKEESVSVLFD